MASVVQVASATVDNTTTISVSLASPATAGNRIVVAFAFNRGSANGVFDAGSGLTETYSAANGTGCNIIIGELDAAGGETSFSATATLGNSRMALVAYELADVSTPTYTAGSASAATTLTIGPETSAGLTLAAIALGTNFTGTWGTFSDSFATDKTIQTAAGGNNIGLATGSITGTGSRSTTLTWSVAVNAVGVLIDFTDTAGGGTLGGPVTTATEADTAVALAKTKQRGLTATTETDAAQVLTGQKVRALAVATETDSAVALIAQKQRALTPVTETDTALALTRVGTLGGPVTPAAETDTAVALAGQKRLSLTAVTETDSAVGLVGTKRRALTAATETETAVGLLRAGTLGGSITPAAEADTAVALTGTKRRALTPPLESGTAVALAGQKRLGINPATELEVVVGLVALKRRALTPALESGAAQALAGRKALGLTAVGETDEAVALVGSGGRVGPNVSNPRGLITTGAASATVTATPQRATLAAGTRAVITPNRAKGVIT